MNCQYNAKSSLCNCPKKECANHGKCCECVAFHRDAKGDLPFCLRK